MQQAQAREQGRPLTERYQPTLEKLREARDDMKRGLRYAANEAQRAEVRRIGEGADLRRLAMGRHSRHSPEGLTER